MALCVLPIPLSFFLSLPSQSVPLRGNEKSKFNWGAASQFLLVPVPGKHRAAVGPCPQEHAQGPQTQHCQLQVTKELFMPYNVCVLFTPLIVSEDLATFPTPMVIVVIISEF